MFNNSLSATDNNIPNAGGLVVSRDNGETIQIGEGIFVTILSQNNCGSTRVRVVAPKDMRITRISQIPG